MAQIFSCLHPHAAARHPGVVLAIGGSWISGRLAAIHERRQRQHRPQRPAADAGAQLIDVDVPKLKAARHPRRNRGVGPDEVLILTMGCCSRGRGVWLRMATPEASVLCRYRRFL